MTTGNIKRVAVVGGGVTGLTAAFYLYRAAQERGVSVDVVLLEGSGRLGGRVGTLRGDGFVIERGPDSFLARKLAMIRLAEDLGLQGELTGTNPDAKKTYIAKGGVLHPLPAGLLLGVPTEPGAFLETGLLSEEGKRRALAEADIPSTQAGRDETVGVFLERRFGKEMVLRIFEPLLAGIHAGDLYALGLEATFPQFRDMERKYGSVIKGMTEARTAAASAPADDAEGRSIGSAFLTFRGGLSTLVDELEQRLKEYGCDIRTGSPVVSLEKRDGDDGCRPAYRLQTKNGGVVDADAVVMALPASGIADLLEPTGLDASAMRNINYVSVANVVFGYDAAGFEHPLDGSGFLVPRGEGSLITASTWTSSKWPHTAPAGKRLVRCYVGRSGEESNVELSDADITAGVRRDLEGLMGLHAEPEFAEITRLRSSMPQYPVGHKEAAAAFLAEAAVRLPGIRPAGQPFGGVGLPDCVAQGKEAAEMLVRFLADGYNESESMA